MTSDSWAEVMRRLRYHEAGHAGAAHYFDYAIITVIATDVEARTTYHYPAPERWADWWKEACVTMAGPLAGQHASWGEMRSESWDEFLSEAEAAQEMIECHGCDWMRGNDHSELLRLLYQMGGDPVLGAEPEESYRIVVRDSQGLVTRLWAEIEAVARALEEHDTLDGPEVVRIIEQTTAGRYDLAALRSRLSV